MDERVDSPANSDRFVGGLSQFIGGPQGKRTAGGRKRFWTPPRVILALASVVFALHWLQKSPCMSGAWNNFVQYKRGCYSDVLALYFAEHLNEGLIPYVQWPVEYPVLTGIFMGLIGLPVHAFGARFGFSEGMLFYNVNAIVLCALGVLTVGLMIALRRRRPWDAAMLAAAPAMVFSATVNWDLLVVYLTVAAMYLWSKKDLGWAGVLLGLAVAAKFYPLLLVGPLILLGLRSRRMREVATTLLAATVTWMVINVPVWTFWNASWDRFWNLNNTRGVDWGTLWYIGAHFPRGNEKYGIQWFQDLAGDVPALNTAYLLLFLVCCVAIAVLTWFAPRRPRLAQLFFLVLAAFLITGKVWSQQYVLWLIPLAILARPRWGAFLSWQLAEVGYFFAFYGQLLTVSGGKRAFPEWVFVLASAGRLVTLAVLCAFVVRDILRPGHDVVRQTYGDDPDGGVFEGAEDAGWLRGWALRPSEAPATDDSATDDSHSEEDSPSRSKGEDDRVPDDSALDSEPLTGTSGAGGPARPRDEIG